MRSIAPLNEYAVEWIPNQNMATNPPYTYPFATRVTSAESFHPQFPNGAKLVKNGIV